MSSVQKTDVSVAVSQSFTDAQKATGRNNIGANRTVFIDTTATNADINKCLQDGDDVLLRVIVGNAAFFFSLELWTSSTARFVGIVNNDVVQYTCAADSWTNSSYAVRHPWASFTPDTNRTTPASKMFDIGVLDFGYYFDNGGTLRLAMKTSDSSTHYVYLSDQHGQGGGYAVTGSWTYINTYGFSNYSQLERFKGYDTTDDVDVEFEVYYANGGGNYTTVGQYRIL